MKKLFLVYGVVFVGCLDFCSAQTVRPVSASLPQFVSISGGGNSSSPVLSADGHFVVFLSQANNLVTNDSNGSAVDVFIRNLANQTTALVSVNAAGASGGNGHSGSPAVSANGRYVVFESLASNLLANDSNNAGDIFVRDTISGTTSLVSVNVAGTASGNRRSYNPDITPDGRFVLFQSEATDLVAAPVVGQEIYVRDLQTGVTTLISSNDLRSGSDNAISRDAAISGSGRFVSYVSQVTNTTVNPSLTAEVYVRDLQSGLTALISSNVPNYLTNGGIGFSGLVFSSNGQFLSYKGYDSSAVGLFWQDWQAGTTVLVSTNVSADAAYSRHFDFSGPVLDSAGRFVAYDNTGAVFLWDSQSRSNILSITGTMPTTPLLSTDGRYLAFLDRGAAGALSGANRSQLYVFDSVAGTTNLASVSADGPGGSSSDVQSPTMSANGRVLAFAAYDGTLATNDFNHATDVFVRDLDSQTLQLVSRSIPSLRSSTPNGFTSASFVSVSSNGLEVVFSSLAENLVANDTNQYRDVFLRDQFAQSTVLVSANTNGVSGNGPSYNGMISADGRYAAFVSSANDLVANDTNGIADVFLRDLQAGTTLLIGPGIINTIPSRPAINANGQYVSYRMGGGIFRWDSVNGSVQITNDLSFSLTSEDAPLISPNGQYVACLNQTPATYLWDAASNKFNVISTGYNPVTTLAGFAGNSSNLFYVGNNNLVRYSVANRINTSMLSAQFVGAVSVSADGRYVAYSVVTFVGSAGSFTSVYVLDDAVHTSTLASPSFAGGICTNGSSSKPVISPNGRYVAFSSTASDLLPGNTNGDLNIYLRDLQLGTTTLLSANPGGSAGDHVSIRPFFGADGRTVLFNSAASDLVAGDFNATGDLFFYRLRGENFIDTDNDGMDDNWEVRYFGNLSHDGTLDTDGDGRTDLQEFLAGTNPTDRNSVFKATPLAPPVNGALSLHWEAQPGTFYRVQYKNNLSDSNWIDLAAPMSLSSTNGVATDTTAGAAAQRFYRVLVVP